MNQIYSKGKFKLKIQILVAHSTCNQVTMASQDCRIGQLLFKSEFLILNFVLKCLNESK
jgi:hypothetical protein